MIESHPFAYGETSLQVSASLGVAEVGPGIANGTDLFKRADEALYEAKRLGRNRVQLYLPPG